VPKASVSALGAAAAFTTLGSNLSLQSALIAGILAAFCLSSTAVWVGFGTVIGRYLANRQMRRAFNWSMAGLLVLSLIPVFW
jgi:threonine/homoserine/homoserine lactone efflux protein